MTFEEENQVLKAQVKAMQALIQAQRHELRRLTNVRLGVIAGQDLEMLDSDAEVAAAKERLKDAGEQFNDMVRVLRFYGLAANYRDTSGVLSLASKVMQSEGDLARAVLRNIGQQATL